MSSTSGMRVNVPRFDKRTTVAITVSALMLILVLGYFALSYGSVVGTQVRIVGVSRSTVSTVPVSFKIDLLVESSPGLLVTYVNDPLFSLRVDGLLFGTVTEVQGILRPGNALSYRLTFSNDDMDIDTAVAGKAANVLLLTMSGAVDAGWYRQDLSRTVSGAWTGNA